MKGKVKRKVVTSGRLTGAVGANRGSVNSRGVRPEPAYSLYSTDSENQVSTLHQGLDRCAALLSDLLQAEQSVPKRTAKAEAKAAAPPISQEKKVLKKLPTYPGQRGAANNTRVRAHSVPAPGRKLQPPHRGPPAPNRRPPGPHRGPPAPNRRPPGPHRGPPAPRSSPPPHSSVLLSVRQSSSDHRSCPEAPPIPQLHLEDEEDDLVPVRDSNSVTSKDGVLTRDGVLVKDRTETLQNLLSELKALITGHGSVAEMLLGRLELILSSSLLSNDSADLLSLQSENIQLRRRVQTLNQQLQQREEAEQRHNLFGSQAPGLQEDHLAELQRALKDTRSRLQDREEENIRLRTDLEEARRRLQDGEQQRSCMEEEIRNLNRLLQISCSSAAADTEHSGQDPPAPPTDRIAHYLESLSLSEPEATTEPFPQPDASEPRRPPDSSSTWSESSFNTRDEAAFRDGLAALDASIASLQRSIQLDLRR